ncbi:MAG: hypothetical protein ACRC20_00915 [Segniliparus sp.]|uniref:hypothetical protein n=1 Tax=Segniliparus sp. TaxID=2804064 RepID=UPI003F3355A2
MRISKWTQPLLLAAVAAAATTPVAAAAPDQHACQALQSIGSPFHQLDEKRTALQNQLKALHGSHPQQGDLEKWRDLQRQLGGSFRDSQQLLERTADGVANEAAEKALREQASAYQDLADAQDEIVSSDEDSVRDDATNKFNAAAARVAPAADRLNVVERDVCASG